ncbi:GPI anchored protein-like protein [Penicillium canariense]|uniref:GPI anchored protein-like protein n=1 Tax=Penicillium canariense TaxID=189055 RepID=A0A9W9LSD7_9EURO|nr:GPI anchored protein-like protein [Penicillium canariense]KAJ5174275.1 GPI anchored protein-like protein [Penicillium canariense]
MLSVNPGWGKEDQTGFGNMFTSLVAKYNRDILENYSYTTNFYANWDLCNIAPWMAIGFLLEARTMFNYDSYLEALLPRKAILLQIY